VVRAGSKERRCALVSNSLFWLVDTDPLLVKANSPEDCGDTGGLWVRLSPSEVKEGV
jgi:hypothetical protein